MEIGIDFSKSVNDQTRIILYEDNTIFTFLSIEEAEELALELNEIIKRAGEEG